MHTPYYAKAIQSANVYASIKQRTSTPLLGREPVNTKQYYIYPYSTHPDKADHLYKQRTLVLLDLPLPLPCITYSHRKYSPSRRTVSSCCPLIRTLTPCNWAALFRAMGKKSIVFWKPVGCNGGSGGSQYQQSSSEEAPSFTRIQILNSRVGGACSYVCYRHVHCTCLDLYCSCSSVSGCLLVLC